MLCFARRPNFLAGSGSNLGTNTAASLAFLREAIAEHGIQTVVDVPCGDVNFQTTTWEMDSLRAYVGLDIIPRLIALNSARLGFHSNKIFASWDAAQCTLPQLLLSDGEQPQRLPADLVHMRYVLQHLTLDRALQSIINVVESGAKYLIATTYPARRRKGQSTYDNPNIQLGKETHFFTNDLDQPPFSLPPPIKCMAQPQANDESCLYDLRDPAYPKWLVRAKATKIKGHHRTTRFEVAPTS